MFKGKVSSKYSVLVNSATQKIGDRFPEKISPRWRLVVPIILAAAICSLLFISLPTSLSGQSAENGTISGEIITHTTLLAAESPYVVTGDVTVNPGIRLEIEPGVEVAFDGNYAMHIRGTLLAFGTESQPIRFTSNQTNPAAGDWAMLDFRTEGEYGVMEHTIVEYGGNPTRYGVGCPPGALCVSMPAFTLNKSTVQHNASRGVVLVQSDAAITNNIFDDNDNEAILMHACDHSISDCHPTIASNTISNHQRAILRQGAFDPILLGNHASGNDINGIVMQQNASFSGDNHWFADDLPYVVQWSVTVGHPLEHVSLTIEPGTVVKFADVTSLTFAYSATITATGTADLPITFTSLKDDSAGGDTNNDGGTTTASPGDWHFVVTSGAGVSATLEHAVFRYGGGWAASGATLGVDIDSTVIIRNSDVSHSARHGIFVWRGAHAHIEANVIQDNGLSAIEVASVGDVLIDSNRILDNSENGIYVYEGHPIVRNNFFQGNAIAVKVNCNPLSGKDCVPVISPHNRFIGSVQEAIRNLAPKDLCVDALENWWGDETGPQDTSSESDACGLVENPGTGAPVSDGVDYSIWEGGMARPLIAQPVCGTTARNQPTFFGRSLAGSTVSFYDGETLLGQTTAAADNTFSWIPAEPLSDGLHTITAQVTLGGETSLPSMELQLTVDSTLFFDPVGVRVIYDLHGQVFSQAMLDATGCASPFGDLRTPLWVRSGSIMTVTVPFRMTALVESFPQGEQVILNKLQKEDVKRVEISNEEVTVTFTNNSSHIVNYVRYAGVNPGVGTNQDTQYSTSIPLDYPFEPGKTITMKLPTGGFDKVSYLFETKPDVAVGRVDSRSANEDIDISPSAVGEVSLENGTGRNIVKVYIVGNSFSTVDGLQTPGGSFVSPTSPLLNGKTMNLKIPKGKNNIFWVVMEDSNGTIHVRKIQLGPTGKPTEVPFLETKPGGELQLENKMKVNLFEIFLHWHRKEEDPVGIDPSGGLDLLWFLFQLNRRDSNSLPEGNSLDLRLEQSNPASRYSLFAQDLFKEAQTKKKRFSIDEVKTYVPLRKCEPPATLKVVPKTSDQQYMERIFQPLINSDVELLSSQEFVTYFSSLPVTEGIIYLLICDGEDTEEEVPMGEELIDPDGYVYDAGLGIEALIQGAMVTCDMYDEDYQTWSRWPAELYESQINPQVTGADGYYAFFVPPGLYRVRAVAYGYDDHASPDIRVINEVVHYNIPMTGPGIWGIFLPFVIR